MEYGVLYELLTHFGFPIALVIFLLFREKVTEKRHREDLKKMAETYNRIANDNREDMTNLLDGYNTCVKENTVAITHLTTLIKERVK